jgi:serine/threonine protein kinase
MTYQCSACKRSFAEPGFCPFDGTKLAGGNADAPTVLSGQMRAESEGDTQLAVKHQPSLIQTVSAAAAGGTAGAMDSIRRGRNAEYDRLIGETLDGRYYVQRKIGEGGMGVVFAVKHTVIERPLAIKVLKREVMRDQATIKRFIQEARAASRIGHPNIVDVTDFGNTEDGMTYQVMELIDGTTLSKVIKEGAPLPHERTVRIASQIARALVAAHAKGIVHRDLKPENVFLTEREGRPDFVKIVDFGIAKVQPIEGTAVGPRLTKQGAVFGTPEYMSPEQAAGRSDTDARVDVYALGVILYEMIVGRVPFKNKSTVRTIAMVMLDPITPPSKASPEQSIPEELEAIVMKALEKKREDRYATMADLLFALEHVQLDNFTIPDISPPAMLPSTPPGGNEIAADTTPRRPRPPTRPLHEPQFVGTPAAMVSFDHVYDQASEDMDRRSRWPVLVAGLLMLVLGAGGAVFLIMRLRGGDNLVTPGGDAAVIAEVSDAGVVDPVDAQVVVEVPLDAGTRITGRTLRDAGVATLRPGDRKGNVTVEVLTRPGEADVYIGVNYRGPSGVKITERYGTKVKIECKTSRHKGTVEIVFDGNLSAVMCTATRARFCVAGLKNPYDDCEDDPNASP